MYKERVLTLRKTGDTRHVITYLGAIKSIFEFETPAANLVGAARDVGEGLGVLVQPRVQEPQGLAALLLAGLVQQRYQSGKEGR